MKRILICTVIALLAAPVCRAQYYQPTEKPTINVSGSAEVKVTPDEVMLNVGVETRDANLNVAKSQNDERVANSLKFLKDNGVDDKDVQTDYLDVEPNYDYENHNLASHVNPMFYSVRKSISIRLKKPAEFDKILTGLMNNGVNNVVGIDFRTTELRKHRDKARQMAVQAAKEKAMALAGELGVKVGAPLHINAQEYGGWRYWGGGSFGGRGFGGGQSQNSFNATQNAGGGGGEAGETMSAGQISVSATVDVTFLIQ
jgi:uncharacterized protein YggE